MRFVLQSTQGGSFDNGDDTVNVHLIDGKELYANMVCASVSASKDNNEIASRMYLAMSHIIQRTPEVEAIPIKWLEEMRHKTTLDRTAKSIDDVLRLWKRLKK